MVLPVAVQVPCRVILSEPGGSGRNLHKFSYLQSLILGGLGSGAYVEAVALGTSSVERASGLVMRFFNGLCAGDFGTLYPCSFSLRSWGGEIFILRDPCIFVGFSDRFGRFLGAD